MPEIFGGAVFCGGGELAPLAAPPTEQSTANNPKISVSERPTGLPLDDFATLDIEASWKQLSRDTNNSQYELLTALVTRKPHSLTADDLERVAELRLALRRFHAATDRVTAAHGLTPRQYDLLAVLHAPSRDGAVASTLAHELSISRNAMTELVSRAVHAGLVDRRADRNDGRRKPLAPTKEGRQRYEAAAVELRPERDQLLTALRRALREVEEASRGGEP